MPSLTSILSTIATLTSIVSASALAHNLPFQPLVKRADLECPASDGSEYVLPDGTHYRIHCNTDTESNDYSSMFLAQTFVECIQACEASAECNFVTYTGQSAVTYGSCYLKAGYGVGYVGGVGVYLARKLSAAQCL